jgi:hypothetical protein
MVNTGFNNNQEGLLMKRYLFILCKVAIILRCDFTKVIGLNVVSGIIRPSCSDANLNAQIIYLNMRICEGDL